MFVVGMGLPDLIGRFFSFHKSIKQEKTQEVEYAIAFSFLGFSCT